MFKKILIANRGEIAVRCIRACHALGVRAVAVYTRHDTASLHRMLADEAMPVRDYLDGRELLQVARQTRCDAVFPGYGFLSENSRFARSSARQCAWIGPSHTAIDRLGDKARSRRIMESMGVPVVPGSPGEVKSLAKAVVAAEKIGYPIMIKAAAGGGGKGMRIAEAPDRFPALFEEAQREAEAFFAHDAMYLERFIVNPKHIEFQVLGDSHGHVVHLGTRECSVQRRHQKMIEEGPAPSLSDAKRDSIGATIVHALKRERYTGAGTLEFIYDGKNLYFIEVNTRVQVEHPVTELVTGVDIVKTMIRVAAGEELGLSQADIRYRGHVIECRINAEDPADGFLPAPGRVDRMEVPRGPGIRIDTALYHGCEIPSRYDSLIAKVLCQADNREASLALMRETLDAYVIEGDDLATTTPFLRRILDADTFRDGTYTTGLVEAMLERERQAEARRVAREHKRRKRTLLERLVHADTLRGMIEHSISRGGNDLH